MSKENKTAEEVIKRYFGSDYHDLLNASPFRIQQAMEEYAQSYHHAKLEEAAKELPTVEQIKVGMDMMSNCDNNYVGGQIEMREKASKVIARKDEEINAVKKALLALDQERAYWYAEKDKHIHELLASLKETNEACEWAHENMKVIDQNLQSDSFNIMVNAIEISKNILYKFKDHK